MSASKYESAVTKVNASAAQIYSLCSNLEHLERIFQMLPEEQKKVMNERVQEIIFQPDSVRVKVDGLGQKITFCIVEKTENDVIKYGLEGIPMEANFWIQMKEIAPMDTRVKLTLKAEIPMMFKMMLGNKLQQAVDQAAQMLASFPFAYWQA